MRIAIVTWELNIKGGTQRQALELANSLQKMGHKVDVFAYIYERDKCYAEICDRLNVKSLISSPSQIINRPPMAAFLNALFWEQEVKALAKPIVDSGKYDVINLHDYQVYKIARYLKGQNTVWMMNDLVTRPLEPAEKNLIKRLSHWLMEQIIKSRVKSIRAIAVLDERNKRLCQEHYGRVSTVVRSGVDLNLYKNFKLDKKDPVKIFASGIFFPHRRFEDLVMAVGILKKEKTGNFHLTINGSSVRAKDYFIYIKSLIKRKKLESVVTITDGLSEKALLEEYAQAHIFVFPNHEQTWGLSVFEAMLARCVAIVSKTSGAHEVLTDEVDSLLVESKSPAAIADKIQELLADRKKMAKIAAAGQRFVIDNLSWDKYAQQMLSCFKKR